MARNGRRMNPLFLFVSEREIMWEIINNNLCIIFCSSAKMRDIKQPQLR